MPQNKARKSISSSTSRELEEMFRELGMNPAQALDQIFSSKSRCPIVIKKKISCKEDAPEMMQKVMCSTWYDKIPQGSDGQLLVEVFRQNLKKAWSSYNKSCNRTPKTKTSTEKAIEKPAGGWF